MNLQFTSITVNSDRTWTFAWADTGADSYRVVLYGVELAVVTDTTYTWDREGFTNFPPPVEVVEEGDVAESEVYQPYLLIQWYKEPFAASYSVQEFQTSQWNQINTAVDTGEWVYSYQTRTLEDGTQEKLRVLALDELDNVSAARGFTKDVLANPKPPDGDISITYSASNIVIAEA
jgi:hypothetical protein